MHNARSASLRSESAKATRNAWAKANPEKVRDHLRRWRVKNRAKIAADYAAWAAANPGAKEASRKRWKERNRASYLRSCAQAGRKWRTENKGAVNAKTARRRAAKRKAFVAWADAQKIKSIYAEARRLTEATGIKHQVDHVIPLQHPLVCGLHNEFNLCVLTADENKRKHNHWGESLAQRQERLFA